MSTNVTKCAYVYDIQWETDSDQSLEELGLGQEIIMFVELDSDVDESKLTQEEVDERVDEKLADMLSDITGYLHKGYQWEYQPHLLEHYQALNQGYQWVHRPHYLDQYHTSTEDNEYFHFCGEYQSSVRMFKQSRDFNSLSHIQDFEVLLSPETMAKINEEYGCWLELLICSFPPGDEQLFKSEPLDLSDGSRKLRVFVNLPLLELYDPQIVEYLVLSNIRDKASLFKIGPADA